MFTQRWNHLVTYFSECIPVVKPHITVFSLRLLEWPKDVAKVRNSDSACLGWGLRFWIPKKFPGDVTVLLINGLHFD